MLSCQRLFLNLRQARELNQTDYNQVTSLFLACHVSCYQATVQATATTFIDLHKAGHGVTQSYNVGRNLQHFRIRYVLHKLYVSIIRSLS